MKRQQNTNIHHSRPTNTTLTSKTLSNTFHPKRFLYQNSFKHQHLSVKRHRMTVLTTEALTNNNQQKTVFIRHHFFLKWQLKKKIHLKRSLDTSIHSWPPVNTNIWTFKDFFHYYFIRQTPEFITKHQRYPSQHYQVSTFSIRKTVGGQYSPSQHHQTATLTSIDQQWSPPPIKALTNTMIYHKTPWDMTVVSSNTIRLQSSLLKADKWHIFHQNTKNHPWVTFFINAPSNTNIVHQNPFRPWYPRLKASKNPCSPSKRRRSQSRLQPTPAAFIKSPSTRQRSPSLTLS